MKYANDCGAWACKLLWFGALVIFASGVAATCRADCREGLADRLVDLEHDDADGFFLRTTDAECLLHGLELVPRLERQITLLGDRLQRSDERYAAMLEATGLGSQTIVTLQEALDRSIRRAVELEDEADAWHKSPFLWFGAGVVVTSLAVVVGLVALGGS